jgi:hypothetical protein
MTEGNQTRESSASGSAQRSQRRAAQSFTRGGPVTVIRPDGSREIRNAYSTAQIESIDRKARRQPRTWDEINSFQGGGADT